ncbi:MAG: type II toxin-antitoxin system VapC family toxin [Solirubrobacteraceae bacterium MAG38_C4-C5]|nr:type II toxin-antitoxin system VapC family toxin [Candidatus Siliceabacter maunaloa]
MLLIDVNVLVYASRPADERQERVRDWLQQTIDGPEAFGVSELVLSGFLRVVTHPRTFKRPTTTKDALRFAMALRDRPNAVTIQAGPRHWEIFTALCEGGGVRGNLVPDAYLAALAIESGSEWITADRGFARFAGLRWRDPLDY